MRRAESTDEAFFDFPALPTETEIYILPDGEIVVADLPVELIELVERLDIRNSIDEMLTSQG